MNVLYISSVCSQENMEEIFKAISDKSGIAIQKFHRLLLEGFANENFCYVETLSTIPVSPEIHKKRFWYLKSDRKNGVIYNYIPIINFPVLKNSIVFVYSFFKLLFWKFPENKSSDKIIICDVLSFSVSTAAQLAFKLRGISVTGLFTDIPGINVRRESVFKKIFNHFRLMLLNHYDGYILLTRQMNGLVNRRKKPFIIMEGLADSTMAKVENTINNKFNNKVIIYAGGLYERYGIKKLVEAFIKLNDNDIELNLYGEGPLIPFIKEIAKTDVRIQYKGVVPNSVVVKDQIAATLLVNPRPSMEEFSKYSFPSKNIEYMASGTPLATTLLPGMPTEYLPYIYLFRDESVNGIYLTLQELLEKSQKELNEFGLRAKEFILENKNNIAQAKKIMNFFSGGLLTGSPAKSEDEAV